MAFLQLDDVIIHPSLSPVISFLFLSGTVLIARRTLQLWRGRTVEHNEIVAAFMIGLGVVSVTVQLAAYLRIASPLLLRLVGYSVCIAGAFQAAEWTRSAVRARRSAIARFSGLPVFQRTDASLLVLVLVGYLLCVSGPVTDTDSLDYHVGYPLEILRNGGNEFSKYWLTSRLIGTGEYLNLLGLGMGTDNLGAFTQLSALGCVLVLLMGLARDDERRILVLKLVLSTMVLLFLVPTQKPQLIGAAGVITAGLLVLDRDRLDTTRLVLAAGSLSYAMSIKYSLYIVGACVVGLLVVRACQRRRIVALLITGLLSYGLFLFPTHFYNAWVFGDPVSPFLASFLKPFQYEYVADFTDYLKSCSFGNLPVPIGLIVPPSLGKLSVVIGVGALAPFFCRNVDSRTRMLLVLALFSFVLIAMVRGESRYFLTTYLFAVGAVGASPALSRLSGCFSKALSVQLLIVAVAVGIGSATLFPGALSFPGRERAMNDAAAERRGMAWLDERLPLDAIIVSDLSPNALMPRPFIPRGYSRYLKRYESPDFPLGEKHGSSTGRFVLVTAEKVGPDHPLFDSVGKSPMMVHDYRIGTRNPWNSRMGSIFVYPFLAVPLE